MENDKDTRDAKIGFLMGKFFAEVMAIHDVKAFPQIDTVVESAMILLDESDDVSPAFREYLKYVVKKTGEQRKMDVRFREKDFSHHKHHAHAA